MRRRSRIGETKIRSLRPSETPPPGEPRRYVDKRGYVRLRWKVGKGEYVETYEHRLVAGLPAADVHHDDEDKGNNAPENLHTLSRSAHLKEHGARWTARSKSVTQWGGERSQYAFDKKQRRLARVAERRAFLERIAALYAEGKSTIAIGQEVGRSAANVSVSLREAGVAPRNHGRTYGGVPSRSRQLVHARSCLACERCGRNLKWGGGQVHHRVPRQMGGSKEAWLHQPSNLLHLCLDCHAYVEDHREEAYDHGWLVHRTADPRAVPVLIDRGTRHVYLLDDGTVLPAFIHLYCCGDTAMCGFRGPDERPDAESLPRCPTCVERASAPCSPTCPEGK